MAEPKKVFPDVPDGVKKFAENEKNKVNPIFRDIVINGAIALCVPVVLLLLGLFIRICVHMFMIGYNLWQ